MTEIPHRQTPTPLDNSGQSRALIRRPWLQLTIVLIGTFMALLDISIVNVALPTMQRTMHAGNDALTWIVAAYTLAFGITLIPAGRLGDVHGRKRMFLVGMATFTVCSAFCAMATDTNQLIAARAGQGTGAGIFLPQISAFIQAMFQGRDRAKAFGYMGSVVGLSTAIGPIVGGIFIDFASWRWMYLINIPIGTFALFASIAFLDETERFRGRLSLDLIGLGLLTLVLVLFELPLIEGQPKGWPWWTWVCLSLVLPALSLFAQWESHQENRHNMPVIPSRLLEQRAFVAGCGIGMLYFASFTSMLFSMSVTWQEGFHRSALQTGLTILPFPLGGMLSAAISARMTVRFGRRIIQLGVALVFFGFLAIVMTTIHAPRVSGVALGAPLFIAGLGNGLITGPSLTFILANVPKRFAGVAGAITQTAQRIGSAVGISATATLLFTTVHAADGVDSSEAFRRGFAVTCFVDLEFLVGVFLLTQTLPRYASGQALPRLLQHRRNHTPTHFRPRHGWHPASHRTTPGSDLRRSK